MIHWTKIAWTLVALTFCLFWQCLYCETTVKSVVFSFSRIEFISSLFWCATFIFLTRRKTDFPLVILLSVATTFYFLTDRPGSYALVLVFGVMLGKGTRYVLQNAVDANTNDHSFYWSFFLTFVISLLGFSSWFHLEAHGNYSGPRWMGLWDNPNTYGMLMGTGSVLAIGLLVANLGSQIRNYKTVLLWVAVFMMGVGTVMSYSRGAWVGTAIGSAYLSWAYGKLKWRYVFGGIAFVAAAGLFFAGNTPDSAAWYVKRADLARPSAQNRVTAWKAGFKMMVDHPLGVGWNKAGKLYEKDYSPPQNGSAAIMTNDYLIIGTELGIPALGCFLAYMVLCFRNCKLAGPFPSRTFHCPPQQCCTTTSPDMFYNFEKVRHIQIASRAGAVVMLVGFWFDGVLFVLPTAAVFWILLELGKEERFRIRPRQASLARENSV